MQTHLYFVTAQDPDGDLNLDLFVEAEFTEQARALWSDWLKTEFDETFEPIPTPTIYQLPALTGARRALPWHAENGVRTVIVA